MSKPIFLRKLIVTCLLLGLGLPAQVVCPQNAVKPAGETVTKTKPAAPATKKADKNPEGERVKIENADLMSYDPNTKTYHLTGNVVFANKNTRLYCDQADYNEQADTAKATGHLRATDPDSVITGDLMEADFGKELTIVTGNVTIVTQKKKNKTSNENPPTALAKPGKSQTTTDKPARNAPKAQPADTTSKDKSGKKTGKSNDYQEKKTTITCERLEYYYADDVKKMIATPRVKAIQEDKTVWADEAVYEDLPRLITLTGNVILVTEKGDEMHCAKAVVSVDDEWVKAEKISGVTLRKNKNEPSKSAPKPAEKPATGETPPPAAEAPPAAPPTKDANQ